MHDTEQAAIVGDKYAIPEFLRGTSVVLDHGVDVIDISGALLASPLWSEFVQSQPLVEYGPWRVVLLEPGSKGAAVRANESTVWAGNQVRMETEIRQRANRIRMLAKRFSIPCEIRWYGTVPVSRYMRVGDTVFQSYYPSDRTAQDLPILALQRGGILEARAKKEFDVAWATGLDQSIDG